jgi:hypothetical protein
MKNYKNYLIALLTGLLALSLSTQPSQGAGSSKEAKIIEYAQCLKDSQAAKIGEDISKYLFDSVTKCAKYKP